MSRDAVEERVRAIWADVLGRQDIGAGDEFVDLGGDSLAAVRVAARALEAWGARLAPAEVLGSTVARLAARLRAPGGGPSGPPPARPHLLPLSFPQRRLWIFERFSPGGAASNLLLPLELEGPVAEGAVEHALAELTRRHEALRTGATSFAGEPVQLVLADAAPAVEHGDLRSLPDVEREAEVVRLARLDLDAPFAIDRPPLLRARVLRLAGERHLVLLILHHLVADDWSLRLIERELRELLAGRRPPEPRLQYADFTLLQRARLEAGAERELVETWQARLAGARTVLGLAAGRPAAGRCFVAASDPVLLGPDVAAGVERLARRERATTAACLLAAFAAVLGRHTGETDLCIGCPAPGRPLAALEGTVGCFADTIVVRADLDGRPTFEELVRRVRDALLDALAHRELPFELLVDALRIERLADVPPLVQAMFAFDSAPGLPGLPRTPALGLGAAVFDLALVLRREGRGLAGELHRGEGVEPGVAERLRTLLAAAVREPDRRVDELPLLPPEEREQVLERWNGPVRPFAEDRCIHELVEDVVDRAPDLPALHTPDGAVAYRELDRRANQVAARLCRLGVGPEDRVALFADRTPEMIAAMLGVLKAGAAYVPLDAAYPMERLTMMLADSSPRAILALGPLPAALPTGGSAVVPLGPGSPVWDEPDGRPRRAARPQNLAYVTYTSGSTGRPKGVLLSHVGVTNVVAAVAPMLELGPGSRFLQFASPMFDASVFEIFLTLASGAALVVAPADALMPGPELVRTCREHGVTALVAVPSVLVTLDPDEVPALSLVVSAGEAMTPDVPLRWRSGRRLFNAYGPTEVTIVATLLRVGGEDRSIGGPFANVRTYVLDAGLQPLPPGCTGELWVGGVGVARGYLAQPGLTAERFQPDPFSGGRMYRTGDLARWRRDGRLDFLGRADDQVKVRGFRIEPGEVRSVLLGHPGVERCVVGARDYSATDRRLVAWYVGGASPAELRTLAASRLPAFMVPSAFVPVGTIPALPNGKVDWRALPAPAAQPGAEAQRPRTDTERALARIWREVLVVEREVGPRDDFFGLGGHSLVVMQAVSRVQAELGVELPLRTLFEHPTLEACAREIDRLR